MKTSLNNLLKSRVTRWGFQTRRFVGLGLIATGLLAGALLIQAKDMVPYHSKTIGHMVVDPTSGTILSIEEVGIGSHLGKFTLTGGIDEESGYFLITATAANGDNLFIVVVGLSGNTVEMAILNGTGRFEGASGYLTATTTVNPNPVNLDPLILAYTGAVTGEISTVGSSKKK